MTLKRLGPRLRGDERIEGRAGAFFEGLDGGGGGAPAPGRAPLAEMLAAPGGSELAAAWPAVPPGPVRSRLTALVVAVGDGAREVSAG